MKKKSTEKRIKCLIGNYLIPSQTSVNALNLGLADLLIFKEWLDIEFGDIFVVEDLANCNTIAEIVEYVQSKISEQQSIHVGSIKSLKDQTIEDNVGFLIFDLSQNDATPLAWNDLSASVQNIFLKVINQGIDVAQAQISQKDNELFYFLIPMSTPILQHCILSIPEKLYSAMKTD